MLESKVLKIGRPKHYVSVMVAGTVTSSACGVVTPNSMTDDLSEVDCINCMKTKVFKKHLLKASQ